MGHDGGERPPRGEVPAADGRTRFFQIGMQRCGTTSIALFLERCNIPCVHYDEGRLAKRIRVNIAADANGRWRGMTTATLLSPT